MTNNNFTPFDSTRMAYDVTGTPLVTQGDKVFYPTGVATKLVSPFKETPKPETQEKPKVIVKTSADSVAVNATSDVAVNVVPDAGVSPTEAIGLKVNVE